MVARDEIVVGREVYDERIAFARLSTTGERHVEIGVCFCTCPAPEFDWQG